MEATVTRAAAAAGEVLAGRIAAVLRDRGMPDAVRIGGSGATVSLEFDGAALRDAEFGRPGKSPRPVVAAVIFQSRSEICAAVAECLREDLL